MYGYNIYLTMSIYQSITILYIEDEVTFGIIIPILGLPGTAKLPLYFDNYRVNIW